MKLCYQVSREITQKVQKQEICFLQSAHCLMLIDIFMKFRDNRLHGFQVIVRTQLRHNFMTDKVPRDITVVLQEFRFLISACLLM